MGGWGGGGGGWEAEGGLKVSTRTQTAVLCLQYETETDTIHMAGQDGRWKQFGTTWSPIDAPQWQDRPCSAPSWFGRVDRKPSVKADLAIYSHSLGVSG